MTETTIQPKRISWVWFIVGIVVLLGGGIAWGVYNAVNTIKSTVANTIGDGKGNTVDVGGLLKKAEDLGSNSSADLKIGDILKGKIPSGFPESDVPLIPNSSVVNGSKQTNSSGISYEVILSVDKSQYDPSKAFEYYSSELKKRGWEITDTTENSYISTLSAKKTGWKISVSTSDYYIGTKETMVSIQLDDTK
jgi:hypothetical protein